MITRRSLLLGAPALVATTSLMPMFRRQPLIREFKSLYPHQERIWRIIESDFTNLESRVLTAMRGGHIIEFSTKDPTMKSLHPGDLVNLDVALPRVRRIQGGPPVKVDNWNFNYGDET